MNELITFTVLGLGQGAIIALAGLGLVQTYRGSGVLNFAQGAVALVASLVFVRASAIWGWGTLPAVAVALFVSLVIGALTELLVMRPLTDSSPLVRLVATFGVLQILQAGGMLLLDGEALVSAPVTSFYPKGSWRIGDVNVGYDRLTVIAIALVLTAILSAVMRRSSFGRATRAVAENQLAARALGLSPFRVALASWAIGGLLGGVAGVLLTPIGGLSPVSTVLLVVPALGASVVGRFGSYWGTTAAALALGVAGSHLTRATTAWGWPSGLPGVLPALVIVVALLVRGSAFPRRDELRSLLPRVGAVRPPGAVLVAAAVLPVAIGLLVDGRLANALTTTAIAGIVGTSLYVVTGLSGQVSLGQYCLAGIGALTAARLSGGLGWPTLACVFAAVLVAAAASALFALPSLRTRGPALGIVTLAMSVAVELLVFGDPRFVGASSTATATTPFEPPDLFGWPIAEYLHPNRYAAVSVGALVVCLLAVASLRRGTTGRRLLAVRSNERAAAATGIDVGRSKFYAFAVGAGLAAIGGSLQGFRGESVSYAPFSFLHSIEALTFAIIGGIGYVAGPVVGASLAPSGLLSYYTSAHATLTNWLTAGSGVLLVVSLIANPDGIARLAERLLRRRPGLSDPTAGTGPRVERSQSKVSARALVVTGLTVDYRSVRAADGIELTVAPGDVVGLIGPNGAGKTSVLDAISGFASVSAGHCTLGGIDITAAPAARRARLGLARCFQTVELFDDLTVADNLLVAAEGAPRHAWLTDLAHPRNVELSEPALAVAEDLGVLEHLAADPRKLNHGTRRLVGVARAAVARPSVILLDEPAAGLDDSERHELAEVIRSLARERGIGVLLVEHDVALVASVADTVVVLDRGCVIFSGATDEALADPAVRAAYLGDVPTLERVAEVPA